MKSLLMNKRFRFTVSGLVICLLAAWVWWDTYYVSQLLEYQETLQTFESAVHRLERLKVQKNDLNTENLVNTEKQDDLKRLSGLLVGGGSAGDVNTEAQKLLRAFWDTHAIKLDTYKEIPGGKWRDNDVVKINYQFKCELDDLSVLLEFFETLEKVIRIETLNVHYLNRPEDNLQVILTLGILSIANKVI